MYRLHRRGRRVRPQQGGDGRRPARAADSCATGAGHALPRPLPDPGAVPDGVRPCRARHRLPALDARRVAEVESRFKPDARSQAERAGCSGAAIDRQALNLSVDTPATNVLAGARYLKILLDRYSRTDLALAAYNAGPTAVDRAGGAPGGETLAYVANVQPRWAELNGCS